MATVRLSYRQSDGMWVVKKSGRMVRAKETKRQAKNVLDRTAQPGDTKIIERKSGSVMSKKTVRGADNVNPMMSDDSDDSGGFLNIF